MYIIRIGKVKSEICRACLSPLHYSASLFASISSLLASFMRLPLLLHPISVIYNIH